MLNLETNQIMETCEVTFDKTIPCSLAVFECAGDDAMAEMIFEDKENDDEDEDDEDHVPSVAQVPTTSTTVDVGPTFTPSMTQ